MSTTNGDSASKLAQRATEQGKHAAQNAAKAASVAAQDGLEAVDAKAEKVAKTPVNIGDSVGAGSLIYGLIWAGLKIKNSRGHKPVE